MYLQIPITAAVWFLAALIKTDATVLEYVDAIQGGRVRRYVDVLQSRHAFFFHECRYIIEHIAIIGVGKAPMPIEVGCRCEFE